MKSHFRKNGWIYIPVSLTGWLVAICYGAVSIFTLVIIGETYNSLTNSLIRFFPYFTSFSVIYFWIASNCSGKAGEAKSQRNE
jgi:hypothetical protein